MAQCGDLADDAGELAVGLAPHGLELPGVSLALGLQRLPRLGQRALELPNAAGRRCRLSSRLR